MRMAVVAISGLLSLGVGGSTGAQAPKAATTSGDSTLIAAERAIWELLKRQQWNAFDDAIAGETFVESGGISIAKRGTSATALRGLVTKSYALEDATVRMVTPDVAIVTYRMTIDQTFNGQRTPSPIYNMSVWQRKAGKWSPVAHAEAPASNAR
jgi:hypothetical protein